MNPPSSLVWAIRTNARTRHLPASHRGQRIVHGSTTACTLAGPSRAKVLRRVAVAALVGLVLLTVAGSIRAGADSHCSSQATDRSIRDCETLLGLKDELRGAEGADLNWAGDLPIDQWNGVQVNSAGGVGTISFWAGNLKGRLPPALGSLPDLTTLTLPQNQLTGEIPVELANLSNLKALTLDNNRLSGSIPRELGNLSKLNHLRLSFNQLSGSIPRELGNLSNLVYLTLRDNRLTGRIPEELGNLGNLLELGFRDNQLSGPIPTELGNLTNLTRFYAENNRLSGPIPAELGNLTSLLSLQLRDNRLTGQIPAELGNLTSLETLELTRNQLTGEIPSELGDLTNLQFLSLGVNKLTGEIPSELGSLTSVTTFWIWGNRLTGEIPSELGGLSSVTSFALSQNQLTGEIPSELGDLSNLQYLFLQSNRLTGAIPAELGSLSNLYYLYLQSNQLTGGIPAALGSLSNLQELSLHRNSELGGAIPVELGNLAQLRWLWLDKAGLTGAIPAQLGNLAKLQVLALSCNELSGVVPGALGDTGSGVTGNDNNGNPLGTHIYLQGNDLVDAEDQPLRQVAQLPASLRSAADGGTKRTSPELELTLTGLCRGDSPPEPAPRKSKSKPKPPPPPPPLGLTDAARAVLAPDGTAVRLERLDTPGQVLEVSIGSASADVQTVVLGGVIRDAADGQTYFVVRLQPAETDGRVRRLWVPPDSPLVGQIAWPDVIANYTVPTAVLAAIPLYGLPTVPGQALRTIDPDDPRIYRWDAETHQWRHVPDPATFQALGLYWCDVSVADPDFFNRLPDTLLGPPYPASTQPVQADYPTCRTS